MHECFVVCRCSTLMFCGVQVQYTNVWWCAVAVLECFVACRCSTLIFLVCRCSTLMFCGVQVQCTNVLWCAGAVLECFVVCRCSTRIATHQSLVNKVLTCLITTGFINAKILCIWAISQNNFLVTVFLEHNRAKSP